MVMIAGFIEVYLFLLKDNNPFSEGYQEREKMEKAHTDPVIPSVVTSETGNFMFN